jgi:hypothetical protein
MMETVCTSETPVHFNVTTRRYIPEDSELHTSRHENLKSHIDSTCYRETEMHTKYWLENLKGKTTVKA